MTIAIIKYNAGNVQSVTNALRRMGIEPIVTDDAEELKAADKVIFPGVGEAETAMNYLKERGLDKLIPSLTQPFLGICLGLQLMCKYSEEGDTPCLDVFDIQVKRFDDTMKVPQIGWNNITEREGPLFEGIEGDAYVYFVHSFYAELSSETIAKASYANEYAAAISKDNFYATQFHPEKSGPVGEKILENFINI